MRVSELGFRVQGSLMVLCHSGSISDRGSFAAKSLAESEDMSSKL